MRVFLGLVEAVERAGIPRAEFIRNSQVDATTLEAPDSRISRATLYRLCELALDVTADPEFGLRWAETLASKTFVPVSQLVAHATTLGQGFELLEQYSQLLTDSNDYRIREDGDSIILYCLPLDGESERLNRMSTEMIVGGFYRLIRSFGVDAAPIRVGFAYSAPAYSEAYERFFGSDVRFDQPFSGLSFDRSLLSASSPAKDDDVREALLVVADRRLSKMTQQAPYALRVRDFLVREGWPHRTDMNSVARALELSVRSLRRRLEEEGTSFNDVLNEALATVAKQLFRDRRRTIQEVAFEMGFAETSPFYRAFRRWTGMTPKAWRESQLD